MEQSVTPGEWRILPIADQAVFVDFGDVISEAVNDRVTSLAASVRQAALPGVTGLVPTYRALTLSYDSTRISQAALVGQLQQLLLSGGSIAPRVRAWTIPVSYGGAQGIDLDDLAAAHQLTPQQVIDLHSAAIYRVYMLGFMPGFAYLGGLDPQLFTSRRESPRLNTPAGSISIGGMQTAVGSVEAPSGWHLIGRTPARSFAPERDEPFLFSAGDRVRFQPIDPRTFDQLLGQADYLPEWTWL